MNVLIAGGTGFVGTALTARLHALGHGVSILTRGATVADRRLFHWQPELGVLDPKALTDIAIIINLAGANIGARRWTAERKHQLYDSRIVSTDLLVSAIAKSESRPRLLINASAIGIYGSRGDELLDESSSSGDDFLARLCRDWEKSALKATDLGVRVVCPRISLVISPFGGVLQRLVPVFRYGFGGRIGSGTQYWSWITIEDLIAALLFLFERADISGPVNLATPSPVTNAEFTRTLARTLHRPALFPVPAPILRTMFGEMADALMLSSQRIVPQRLESVGFHFASPDLDGALERAVR